ncbi:hypothetical protein T07_5440 [Trichinella nelsoni]|uniref:Uncharacterized protein n=1 Tax=Trichinella nelsoni TaxID=6336 RepID=A0A0V0RTD1_9BILA|nr:hypothetical protein T07_5440 [Trichinella nelsoni]
MLMNFAVKQSIPCLTLFFGMSRDSFLIKENRITNVIQIIDHFIEQDFVHELQRSSKASRDVLGIISCYQEIQHERKCKELNQSVKRSRIVQRKVTITAE